MRFLTAGALLIWVAQVSAQDAITLSGWDTLATLKVGSALAAGPTGLLYVTDSGNHTVRVFNADGSVVSAFGGPGTAEGQFDAPADVDPTNGLVLVVADLGNSRIQRFTKTFQLFESIPLYATGPQRGQIPTPSSPSLELGSVSPLIPGRPVSLAVSPTNETFAVDETAGRVARWDASRRFAGFIGDDEGDQVLLAPVAVEAIGDQVFVADNGRGEIAVFDTFGSYVRSIGSGLLSNVSSLSAAGRFLLVTEPDRLVVYSVNGRREGEFRLDLADAAVGAVEIGDQTYVLTRRHLLRAAQTVTGARR